MYTGNGKAILDGHHDIEDTEIKFLPLECGYGFFAVYTKGGRISLGIQVIFQDIAQVAVVFGEQYTDRSFFHYLYFNLFLFFSNKRKVDPELASPVDLAFQIDAAMMFFHDRLDIA